jgi:uncharacterized membrane protein YphA (DoxX/SURF4 family)
MADTTRDADEHAPATPADLRLTIEERVTLMDRVVEWVPRLGVAALFLGVGASKFPADGMWVRLFDQIGAGQWFRVFTGAVQVAGALLLLVPRLAWLGAAILACTMVGAIVAQLFLLHGGLLAISPAVLLVITAAIGAQARGWL